MIGSAVWLKLILFAELWETPQHDILYERQRTECGERCHQNGRNGAPPFDVAEGLRLSVDMDACKLQHPPPPPSRRLEGLDEDEVAWALAPPSPSGSTEVFMEEWDDDRRRLDNPKGNESKKVVTPENKCRPENAQIHVNATLDHIYSPVAGLYLVLYATNHWKDPWYQANSPERDTGMFEYDPVGGNISEVHTYACVGSPGYVYMVGCLHEGFPSDDLFMKSVQPPFKDCVQIASICGATCGSGAIEPSFNDPDPTNAGNFHQLKSMHCVQKEEPWICIKGDFPFHFSMIFAIVGSFVLRVVEWFIVLQAKKESEVVSSHLAEYSIFRSQQMNEVTVPIKLRSVYKGLTTGWKDCVGKEDNSFWTSFGTSQAVEWVRIWLCVCMLAMLLALGFGIAHIIMALFPYDKDKSNQTIIANAFGMVLACIQAWMLAEPCLYVMKGRALKVSMRHTELLVLLAIGVAVMVVTGGAIGEIF